MDSAQTRYPGSVCSAAFAIWDLNCGVSKKQIGINQLTTMSHLDAANPVANGQIDHGRVFVTFTRHTDQKITHGLLFESLLRALKERGVILKAGQPTTLVDLGCGEGRTAYEMIDAINRVHPQDHGVNYYGLDDDDRFVRSTEKALEAVQGPQRLRVINVQRANVLQGEPLPVATMDDVLLTLGHVLYYTHSPAGRDETRRRIVGVLERVLALLGRDGLCLLNHNAHHCQLATLRASVANSVEARPTSIVAEIAEEKRLSVMSLFAPFRLGFPRLTPIQWQKTKEATSYQAEAQRDPRFLTALELLSFVAQRSLNSLAQEQKLATFVDKLTSTLDCDGVLHGCSEYQLLLSPRQSPGFREGVEAARQQSEQAMDCIVRKAAQALTLPYGE